MPAFKHIVDRMQQYFDMDIKATRFNWYRDSKDWKPYHHDAAAVKAHFAQTQNCTVAVSVGQERECAFQHATTGTVVSCPQPNGCAYAFGRDVNLEWRHGVLPTKKKTALVEYLSLHGVTSNRQMRVQDRKITHF